MRLLPRGQVRRGTATSAAGGHGRKEARVAGAQRHKRDTRTTQALETACGGAMCVEAMSTELFGVRRCFGCARHPRDVRICLVRFLVSVIRILPANRGLRCIGERCCQTMPRNEGSKNKKNEQRAIQ